MVIFYDDLDVDCARWITSGTEFVSATHINHNDIAIANRLDTLFDCNYFGWIEKVTVWSSLLEACEFCIGKQVKDSLTRTEMNQTVILVQISTLE